MDEMDNVFRLVHEMINLIGKRCCLFHLPDEELPEAVDCIQQEFGRDDIPVHKVSIPICAECAEALLSGEWTLLYCLNCNESRWALNRRIRTQYIIKDKPINWLKSCPGCHKKEDK